MSTCVLVLAAGEARRIGRIKKQLLRPKGTWTILERTCWQVKQRHHIPWVVTHDPEIAGHEERINPHARRWTAETLLHTAHAWQDRTLVLLGDVVYSRDCLDRVFREPAAFMAFGHEYEVFAFSFDRSAWGRLVAACKEAIAHAEEHAGPGKLRTVYQAYNHLPLGGDAGEADHWHRICYVADYTMDVDTPEDWEILQRKCKQNRVRDEMP